MVRRVVLGGGEPLVGPQEELRYSSKYTPRGVTSSPGREAKQGFSGFIPTNKQTKKNWRASCLAAQQQGPKKKMRIPRERLSLGARAWRDQTWGILGRYSVAEDASVWGSCKSRDANQPVNL